MKRFGYQCIIKVIAAHIQVGVGFIPTLAAAGYLLCILSAVGRAGINPAPTADECCNDLIIKLLQFFIALYECQLIME